MSLVLDVRSPGIIYGTAWKKAQTASLVAQALQLGFRGLDTACQPKHYNEAGVGAGLAACIKTGLSRADVYLQTKFTPVSGQDPNRIPYDPRASLAEQVAQSIKASQRNLQTDYVDCLVLHSPMADEKETAEVWRAMEAIFDAGAARELGISNFYDPLQVEHLYRSVRVKPAVVQNRFHAKTGYDHEIRAFCVQQGIVYQSFWTLSANPQILASEAIETLAQRYSRTPAQILFRCLTQEAVVPLTGTKSEMHMREDLAIFEFELTDGEREAVKRCFSDAA